MFRIISVIEEDVCSANRHSFRETDCPQSQFY